MKLMKWMSVALVVVAVAVIAAAWATPAFGQAPEDRRWLQELTLLEGPGSHIGVAARDLEPAEVERLKVEGGVYVERVDAGSPAEKAGLQAADVVVDFDGERVRSLRQFTRLVRESPPDRQVRTTVFRDGRRTELSVTPAPGGRDLAFDTRRLRDQIEEMTSRMRPFDFNMDVQVMRRDGRLGVRVQELTPELGEYFGASGGVLVASVTSGSPAAQAGVKAGDVITSIDGRSVASSGDLVRELRGVAGDGSVTLGIVRDKKATTLTAKIEPQPERRTRRQR